jgi:hypothetical protein
MKNALLSIVLGLMATAAAQAAPVYSDTVLASNPVAYFRMNETSGTTATNAVTGSSVTGNYGTYNSGAYTLASTNAIRPPAYNGLETGNVAVSLTAPNQDSSAFLGTSVIPNTTNYTVEFWINTQAPQGLLAYLAGVNGGGGTESLGIASNGLNPGMGGRFFAYGSQVSSDVLYFASSISAGWHYLALRREGTALNLYIDGVKDTTTVTPNTTFVGTGKSFVFGTRSDATWGMNGLVDEAAIYDAALSDSVILAHYNSAIPEPGMLALLAVGGLVLFKRRRA